MTDAERLAEIEERAKRATLESAARWFEQQAVKANKGPGKSTIEAWLNWNFLLTRPHPKMAATDAHRANLPAPSPSE